MSGVTTDTRLDRLLALRDKIDLEIATERRTMAELGLLPRPAPKVVRPERAPDPMPDPEPDQPVLSPTLPDLDCKSTGFSGEGRCIEPAEANGYCVDHQPEPEPESEPEPEPVESERIVVPPPRRVPESTTQRLEALGLTSKQVKQWAVSEGLIPAVVQGRLGAHLLDAYLDAHPELREVTW